MAVPGYVIPGQIISPVIDKDDGHFRKFRPGLGAKLGTNNGVEVITATLVGKVEVSADETPEKRKKETQFVVAVHPPNVITTDTNRKTTTVLPDVGDVVLCRITRITSRQAHAEILVVESQQAPVTADSGAGVHGAASGVTDVLGAMMGSATASGATAVSGDIGEGFGGIIRVQDVRATERDKVKIPECFKPGDIVRASVISLGDGTNYYLSTAQNELGVVFAKSAAGQHMFPVDWQTMKCAATGQVEPRKCAKPF